MPGTMAPLDVNLQIPYHFRCPISLELMRDPVTVCTGQTYDRSSIESWIATGNTTCPVTRSPLSDFTLIPNHTLRRLIQQWCVSNRSNGVERIPTPKQPADPTVIRSLIAQCASSGSIEGRLAALRRLGTLGRDSEKNRSVITSLTTPDLFFSILFSDRVNSGDLHLEALSIAIFFPFSETDCVAVASCHERLTLLASLLFYPSIEIRANAAALIESVSAGTRSQELRMNIGNTEGIFPGLVQILNQPLGYPRAVKIAIKALFSLCLVKQNRQAAVLAGAPQALVNRLGELEKCDAERTLATIELLCRVPDGCSSLSSHALTVPILVKVILKISDRATEYAAGSLLCLCSSSEKLQRDAVSAGILTQLLLLVQSDCTDRAKRKAQMLLKLLRDAWPDDPLANSDDFACSDIAAF